VRSIRGGAWAAQKRSREVREAARKGTFEPTRMEKLRGVSPGEAATKAQAGAGKHLEAARKAESMGLTSIPGYAKSLAKQPGKTLRAGMGEQWHAMGPLGRAFIFGYPAAATGAALATPSEPGGPGRLERAGKQLGTIAYGLGPLPLGAQLALSEAAGRGAAGAGRVAGKIGKKKRIYGELSAPSPLEPAGGTTEPEEYMHSERALGIGGS